MIKVALLHFCFEDYTVQLANALAGCANLSLIAPESLVSKYKNIIDSRVEVFSFKKPRIRDPRNIGSMREMNRIVRAIQPDVLHVQETDDPWYDITLLFSKMPPLVTTVHDIFRHPGDRQTTPGSEYTGQISFHRSQQLIVHAQSLKEILAKKFHVSNQVINVIPHGELGSLYRLQFKAPDPDREPHTLLFFGRIWPYKGLKYLLEAMPLVQQHVPDVKLIIAGQGESIEQYFPRGCDRDRFEVLNSFIPIETVTELFLRSTVTVLPYIESSQSGVAALSYGLGTPVIASDVGGLREVVRHRQDGLLVPPMDVQALADSIVEILSDRTLQQKIQAASVARCKEDLNWGNIATQTVEVYQRAILRAEEKRNFAWRP